MVFNAWTLEVMKARMSSIDFRSCESLNRSRQDLCANLFAGSG